MRYFALGVCLIGVMAAGAYASPGQTWGTDFNGTTAATINNRFDQNGTPGWHWGWDNLETPGDGHAYDATEGIGGALKLLDDEQPAGFESSHLAYDIGERSDGTGTLIKWGGVVVARVKDNSTTGSGVGFGYSSSDGNHTGILGIKNGSVSMTGWEVANGPRELPGSSAAVPGGTVGKYRTYALGWGVNLAPPPGFKGTSYNVWMLNEGAGTFGYSNNPADWTQIITNITPRSTSINNDAAPDAMAVDGVATGIQLGSWGPGPEGVFGRTASGDIDFDWIGLTQNKDSGVPDVITPWQVDYHSFVTPEPATLVLLSVGLVATLRRRAVR